MAALRKYDVAVAMESAGFRITDDGLVYYLNGSARMFSAAWRRVNRERLAILDAFDQAGPDVEHQLDAAMDMIHRVLLPIGIAAQGLESDRPNQSVAAPGVDTDNICPHGPGLFHAPVPHNRALIHATT